MFMGSEGRRRLESGLVFRRWWLSLREARRILGQVRGRVEFEGVRGRPADRARYQGDCRVAALLAMTTRHDNGAAPLPVMTGDGRTIYARAAFADVEMMSGFAVDITRAVADGAMVEVDAEAAPPALHVLGEAISGLRWIRQRVRKRAFADGRVAQR
jgi:hypothetical protein